MYLEYVILIVNRVRISLLFIPFVGMPIQGFTLKRILLLSHNITPRTSVLTHAVTTISEKVLDIYLSMHNMFVEFEKHCVGYNWKNPPRASKSAAPYIPGRRDQGVPGAAGVVVELHARATPGLRCSPWVLHPLRV